MPEETLQEQLQAIEASTDDKKLYGKILAVGLAVVAVLTALIALYPNGVVPTPVLVCVMVVLGIPITAVGGVMPIVDALSKHSLKRKTATDVQALKRLEAEQAHALKLAEAAKLDELGFELANTVDGVQLYKKKQ